MPCHTSALTAVASLTGEGTIGTYRTALVKVSGLTHRQNAPDTHCITGLGVVKWRGVHKLGLVLTTSLLTILQKPVPALEGSSPTGGGGAADPVHVHRRLTLFGPQLSAITDDI